MLAVDPGTEHLEEGVQLLTTAPDALVGDVAAAEAEAAATATAAAALLHERMELMWLPTSLPAALDSDGCRWNDCGCTWIARGEARGDWEGWTWEPGCGCDGGCCCCGCCCCCCECLSGEASRDAERLDAAEEAAFGST